MASFLQNVINALQAGSFYALIALGYSMVYSVLMLFNFAHGDIFMSGSLHRVLHLFGLGFNCRGGVAASSQLDYPGAHDRLGHARHFAPGDDRRKSRLSPVAECAAGLSRYHGVDDRHYPGDGEPIVFWSGTPELSYPDRNSKLPDWQGKHHQHSDHHRCRVRTAHARPASVRAPHQVGHGYARHGLRLHRRAIDGSVQ